MEWYSINNANDDNEIGKKFPQTDGMKSGYNLHKEDSVWNIPHVKFPDFEPDLDYFVLHNSAKLTDVISVGSLITATGFLVNDKVKNIFDQFRLPLHKYYPAKVMHKKVLYDNYYWLQFGEDNTNLIDFSRSKFQLFERGFPEEAIDIEIKTKEDIPLIKKKYGTIKELYPITVHFYAFNLDFLILPFLWNESYINSSLYKSLIIHNIKGLRYKQVDYIG